MSDERRRVQRADADSAVGKGSFNMEENKHGFKPKQKFTAKAGYVKITLKGGGQ